MIDKTDYCTDKPQDNDIHLKKRMPGISKVYQHNKSLG